MPLSKPEDIEDGPEPPEPSDPEETDGGPMVSSEFMGLAPVTEAIEGIEQNIMELYEKSDGNEAEIEGLEDKIDVLESQIQQVRDIALVNAELLLMIAEVSDEFNPEGAIAKYSMKAGVDIEDETSN